MAAEAEHADARDGVLLLCGSRKPAPGSTAPSATRELLRHVRRGVEATAGEPAWVDLREHPLPDWDGRPAHEIDNGHVRAVNGAVRAARTVVVGAPCYWGGISGVLKNAVDLLGSEAWRDALVASVVVGSDDAAAWQGEASLRVTVAAVGAWMAPHALVIGNPREADDTDELVRAALRYGAYVGSRLATARPAATEVGSL